MSNLKRIIYKTGINCFRMFWRLRGRRTIKAFDKEYHVTANTVFPHYRKFRLPPKGCQSEIVRYTDYVQLHALVNYVEQLNDSPTIIDIGAHHGSHSIILGKILQSKQGKVIAVEPNPESFHVLTQNIRLNNLEDTVICEQVAVADKKARMNIDLSGGQSKLTLIQTKHTLSVEVTTLEELLNKYNVRHMDLLLIDVEGAELLLLRGFPWGSVTVGNIFCELHPYAWSDFGCTGDDMKKFLEYFGYRCFDMYLKEHTAFNDNKYIGPTLLIPKILNK